MRDELRNPLLWLRSDISGATSVDLEIRDEQWQDLPGTDSCWLVSSDGSRTGVYVRVEDDEQQRLADLADQVQDFLHEELGARALPAVWPSCPLHPDRHPLSPVLVAGQAWWRCPASEQEIRRIDSSKA